MVIRALFTLADIVNSNVKEKRLTRLLHDRGIDENTISQAIAAVGYLSLSERDKSNMYRKNPNLDKTDLENKMMAVLLYIFQDLEVAELVVGNQEKAIQASNEARARFARIETQGDKDNRTVLSLSQGEARIVRFSIINYVDKLTMSDEERKELREIDDFVESFLKDSKSQNIAALREKVKKLAYASNVFTVLNDQELNSSVEELKSLVVSENELLLEIVRTKGRDQENFRAKQMELSRSITELNAKIKRLIDSIRSSDPIKYYKG